MPQSERIYLDNAATSWPKPEAVYLAVEQYLREIGAPAGRGVYRQADDAERIVAACRKQVAALLAVDDPSRIIFTQNGTDSLNMALHGLLRPGDHVITSVVEHNSVLRPLKWLSRNRNVAVTYVGCDQSGLVDPDDIKSAVQPNTRLIALVHVSNVTGAIQPVAEAGRIAAEHGLLMLVDAAQSLGHLPVSAGEMGAHLLAAPGHKGLLGPLGVGVLYVAPGTEKELQPLRQGGTGTHSEQDEQPDSLPDKYESGNLNVAGIAGLQAGAAYLNERGVDDVRLHDERLATRLVEGLGEINSVSVFGPRKPKQRVGVVSFCLDGYDPREVAVLLDTAYGVQSRSGFHCAPRMHQALGTAAHGGTVRLSTGAFNSESDVDAAVVGLSQIAAAAPSS